MMIREGNLEFEFNGDAIKFDESNFYRKRFQKFQMSKGVDFLVKNDKYILLLEIKDCLGHEIENKERTKTSSNSESTYERFDDEVAHKVAMSISCLLGACRQESDNDLKEAAIDLSNKSIKVILFLEGDFKSVARTKSMIMSSIQKSINKKLKWLNCKVFVEDRNTCKDKIYSVKRLYN